jgi:uncharacterized repeat protein (TIGR03803 family)
LILSSNTLYGTTFLGGRSGSGTLFAVNTDGTEFRNVYSFTKLPPYNGEGNPTNSDGANPYAGLFLSSNTLFGTAHAGGTSGYGTLFSLGFVPVLPPITTAITISPGNTPVYAGTVVTLTELVLSPSPVCLSVAD